MAPNSAATLLATVVGCCDGLAGAFLRCRMAPAAAAGSAAGCSAERAQTVAVERTLLLGCPRGATATRVTPSRLEPKAGRSVAGQRRSRGQEKGRVPESTRGRTQMLAIARKIEMEENSKGPWKCCSE